MSERYNASLLLDRNLEAGRGDKVAVCWGDERITYRELLARACASGRALRELGVEAGERVLLIQDDHPSFPATFLGAIRIGAVPVPLNPLYKAEVYAHFVADSGARLLIADPVVAGKVRSGAPATGVRIMSARGEVEGLSRFDEVVASQSGEIPPADTRADEMAFWLYSSGSTGKPKGVVHRQRDMRVTCETYARHVLRIRDADVTFSSTKLFHAYGLGNNLSFPYWAGASAVLLSGRPTPEALFDAIERFRPTLFFSVPTLYNAMLKCDGAGGRDLSSIRSCVSAAEALPAEVWHAWKRAFGLSILDGVGSTEMLHIYCSNTPGEVNPGSSGRPVPGYELKILGEEGREAGVDERGDLHVKGESALASYWNQPEKTAASLKEGWFHTGDRYRKDAGGYYWYEGRADDMIKVQGLWVSPIEVEAVLMAHPAVFEAAAVSATVEGFSKVKAFVIPTNMEDAGKALKRELAAFCEERLHSYQCPKAIEFVRDLPRTATGKIQRFKLRQDA